MASGSSGRHNSGSKAFDFGTDDILCSYEDYANQENSNGSQSDSGIGTNSSKEMNKSRLARSSVSPSSVYNNNNSPQEEYSSNNQQEILIAVERTMKKHTDNLMRFLEGISSRLSQLELYCYNLDKSITEIRSDLVRDHTESDSKLKSLDKHVQEVHRSVQILRDKQELAETQKELAKLQLAQKESTNTQQTDGRASPAPTSSEKNTDNASDSHSQQLALALPHQVPAQPSRPTEPVGPPQPIPQSQPYYLPPQSQYLPSDSPYRNPSQPSQPQPNPTAQIHQSPQYQQQWAPQIQQQQPQQLQQSRPPSNTLYPPYLPSQPSNPTHPEPIQMQFAGAPQPSPTRPELPYGYGGRTGQPQPPPQQVKPSYGSQPGDGYPYMMYDTDGGRAQQQHLPQFPPGGYPPNPQTGSGVGGNLMGARPPQLPRNHPYNELIEKLTSMGFRGDHVVAVIQRIEESGQPVDFNSVLDRLNGHSSGGTQRGWQN